MAGAPLGNKNGSKEKRWGSAITRVLARKSEGRGVDGGLEDAAELLVSAALKGEQWALLELGNRIDGKSAQSMTLSGDEDAPLVHRIERSIVRANIKD
jgi:hypothetical protein